MSVYIDPLSRRTGVGRALLARAGSQATGLGVKTLLGFIFAYNEASLRLFARFGFERWGTLPRTAESDGVERDIVIVGLRVV